MLCWRCEQQLSTVRGRVDAAALRERGEWARLHQLICGHCGKLVPHDPVERILSHLSKLARFGLASGSGPLLQRGNPEI